MSSKQSTPGSLTELTAQAFGFYQKGNLAEAERLCLQILSIEPRDGNASDLLGIMRARQGRNAEALVLLGAALNANPHNAEALSNYGNVLKNLARFEEALASFDKALSVKPNFFWALYNRGNTLLSMKRFEEALVSYDQALAIDPNNSAALNNRGTCLRHIHRLHEALACFDKALAISPNNAELLVNRGMTLIDLKRLKEALESCDLALAMRPDFAEALNNRGKALFESDRIQEGLLSFMRSAAVGNGENWRTDADPPHKMRHDQEQDDYLAGRNELLGALVAAPAVRPDPAGSDIAEQWLTAKPQLVVIDNFLADAALEALRRFCLGAPMWRKSFKGGYLGASPENGFARPLLGQIAEELRSAFPAIFRDHPLRYLWAFKYDSQMDGINIHADDAAVNVNFWITPDDANLDPDHGGLIIWDKAAPQDWDFAKYNNDVASIRNFLEEGNAKSVTVPYRANRAVIFDSDLFHQTDKFAFKPGYTNRRINVTLLFGWRESRIHSGPA